jgi:hypothetical protein
VSINLWAKKRGLTQPMPVQPVPPHDRQVKHQVTPRRRPGVGAGGAPGIRVLDNATNPEREARIIPIDVLLQMGIGVDGEVIT